MITKSTMVVIFNFQNSNLLTLSLPTEEVFQVNGQNRPATNRLAVDFHSQPREMLTPKPVIEFNFAIVHQIAFVHLDDVYEHALKCSRKMRHLQLRHWKCFIAVM